MQELDSLDRHLLRLLQEDASLSAADLAQATGASAASCWRRVERLEARGIITGRRAIIDPKALGFEVEVSLRITLDKTRTDAFDSFLAEARKIREVNEIQTFLGRVDVRLNVVARDLDHYQEIYRARILALPHIADIEALMLVKTVLDSERLAL